MEVEVDRVATEASCAATFKADAVDSAAVAVFMLTTLVEVEVESEATEVAAAAKPELAEVDCEAMAALAVTVSAERAVLRGATLATSARVVSQLFEHQVRAYMRSVWRHWLGWHRHKRWQRLVWRCPTSDLEQRYLHSYKHDKRIELTNSLEAYPTWLRRGMRGCSRWWREQSTAMQNPKPAPEQWLRFWRWTQPP